MKATNTLLLLAGGGLFVYLVSHNKHPMGLKNAIESVTIGAWTEKGYPIRIIWLSGRTTEELYSYEEALAIIEQAKQDGARITEDTDQDNTGAFEEKSVQKSIVSLRYRDLGNGTYYLKIAFYDGTETYRRVDEEDLKLYLRNAKYDNAIVETF